MFNLKSTLTKLKMLREVYQSQLHPCHLKELDDVIEALNRSVENTEETEMLQLRQRCLNIMDLVIRTVTNVMGLMDRFL